MLECGFSTLALFMLWADNFFLDEHVSFLSVWKITKKLNLGKMSSGSWFSGPSLWVAGGVLLFPCGSVEEHHWGECTAEQGCSSQEADTSAGIGWPPSRLFSLCLQPTRWQGPSAQWVLTPRLSHMPVVSGTYSQRSQKCALVTSYTSFCLVMLIFKVSHCRGNCLHYLVIISIAGQCTLVSISTSAWGMVK